MNRRQRWMAQMALAIVAGLLAWQLRMEWKQAELRYSALASPTEQRAAGLPAAVREEPLQVEEIAAKNLFSADRNNEIPEPEIREAGPPPPAPMVLGTMKLGTDYEALMSEGGASGGGVRRVKQGEQVGGYRVVEIRDEKVVIEYEGKRTELEIYQSTQPTRSVGQQRPRTGTPAAPVVVDSSSNPARRPAPARAGEPRQSSEPPRGREIKDPNLPPSTRVFIEGNERRLERTTPFGNQVWHEPLQPGDVEK